MRFKLLTISSTRDTGQSAFSKLMNSVGLRHFSLVRRTVIRMSSTNSSYEDAIRKLNSLQSNKQTIEQIKKGLKTGQKCTNIEDMQDYLQRVGIPLSRLDDLSVIHVAGTKGKGSTSAMCESILRQHGFRTGFYSSPHLVAARERVRLCGRALTREEFAENLHHVYGLLWDSQKFEGDMPKYFAFLTVLAYHVFLRRRVDVAVVEVGIGGVVDYTNVLRKVDVVGISALGLDHTSILGSTLPEIAAAKAGVMKRGCRAYTVRQPRDAARVLAAYADYVQCPLTVVPDFTSYYFPETGGPYLPVDLDAYRTNASLAIQLSHAWMRAHASRIKNNTIPVVNKNQNGLDNSKLNGVQNIQVSYVNGAHDTKLNGVMNESNDNQNGTYKGHNGMAEVDAVNGIQNAIKSDSILQDTKYSNGSITNTYKYRNNVVKVLQNGSTNVTKSNNENHSTNGYITNQNGLQNDITVSINKVQNGLYNGTELNNNSQFNNHINHSVIQNITLTGNHKAENCLRNGTVLHETNHSSNNISDLKLDKNQNDIYNGIENEALSRMWKDETGLTNGDTSSLVYEVPLETAEGLKQCRWPGRYQVVETEYATFYLDGAHTRESMEICAQWFMGSSSPADRVLIFSATGDRNSETLLQPLTGVSFKQIYFVIPTAHRATSSNHDNYSLVEQGELVQRCNTHATIWRRHNTATPITVLECVADALHSIQSKESKPSVLITGSLHLVGAALSILDPNLSA